MLSSQRHLFNIPHDVVYLNTAYMSPLLNSVVEAIDRGVRSKAHPWKITISNFYEDTERARILFSGLTNSNPENIVIIPSASYGIQIAANNIKIKAGLNLHKDISFFMNQNIKFNELSNDCWVLNMSSEYTKNNIDMNKTELEKYAQSIFEETFDIKNEISFIKSHRWLYAQTKLSYNTISKKNWINSKDNKIFLSGDWVLGKSLSDAWDAGEKLSHYIKILSV